MGNWAESLCTQLAVEAFARYRLGLLNLKFSLRDLLDSHRITFGDFEKALQDVAAKKVESDLHAAAAKVEHI